jgi:APA family basic amino acid/polyamine antiporter
MKKNTSEKNSGHNLERKLGLFPVTNIVIANMIGAGIFTTSGLLMADLQNPLLMMGLWVAGGIIALCGALSYGELGAAMPRAGGEYVFLSRLYHPVLGFLSGWVSFFVGFSAPIAVSAIGFTEYLTRAFPALVHPGILPESIESVVLKKCYAILVIVLFTAIHIRGIVFGARVQNILTLLKVGLILGLVMFGFMLGTGSFNHLSQGKPFALDFGGLKTIGLSLMWIMFAYSGWNASVYIGSEVKDPQKNLPRSLLLGTGAVILVYFFLNLFYLYAIPPAKMGGVISIAGLAAGNSFGNTIENFISVLVGFALFSSLSAFVILGPRVYYSMARDGYFFKFAADIHPRFGVPAKSILLQCGIAAVMVLFGTFDQVLTYMGFSLGIFPILTVAGVFKMRRGGNIPYKSPGFPIVQLVFMLFGVCILLLSFLERPAESSIALGTVAIGIPVYWIFKRGRGSATPPYSRSA